MEVKRYWWYGTEEDREVLKNVIVKYGLRDESQAIRFLARLAMAPDGLKVSLPSGDARVVKKIKKGL